MSDVSDDLAAALGYEADKATEFILCPRCNSATRLDGIYLMCDTCKLVVGGVMPDIMRAE